MTPTRRRALKWVRDNGNKLNLPDMGEPSQRILLTLYDEGLIAFHMHSTMRTWDMTKAGTDALAD